MGFWQEFGMDDRYTLAVSVLATGENNRWAGSFRASSRRNLQCPARKGYHPGQAHLGIPLERNGSG
jgi:hypothetical protein